MCRRHVRNVISIDRVHRFLARAFHAIVAAAAGLYMRPLIIIPIIIIYNIVTCITAKIPFPFDVHALQCIIFVFSARIYP